MENYHEEQILGKAYDSRLMKRLLGYARQVLEGFADFGAAPSGHHGSGAGKALAGSALPLTITSGPRPI